MERQQRLVFGEVAETYDRLRPGYPPSLVDELAGRLPAGARVLDVGCGTGKAGAPLVERGFDVTGVEPDPAMAALARRRYRVVHEADFQQWQGPVEHFDMIVCGQAWHWIPPVARIRHAHELLTPGGWLALFWNRPVMEGGPLREQIDRLYATCAPSLSGGQTPWAGGGWEDPDDGLGHVLFEPAEQHSFPWERSLTAGEYVDLMTTHSNHRLLAEPELSRLLRALRDLIDGAGGRITERYEARLWCARKPAGESGSAASP